jgi:hypothetical protein
MQGQPSVVTNPDQLKHMNTTGNIVGIAEQRRHPFMGFSSAQTLNYAEKTPDLDLDEVFGHKDGKKNAPGLLTASGTGATKQFRTFADDLEKDQDQSTVEGERLLENLKVQHVELMKLGLNEDHIQQLEKEGVPEEDIIEGQIARGRSAATRKAAKAVGQLPYNLRDLQNK